MFSNLPQINPGANGGQILNALASANARAKETADYKGQQEQNKLLHSQNKYADWQNQANATKTQQEARGAAITALTNPLLWATPEGAGTAKSILQALSTSGGSVSDPTMPKPGDSHDSNSLMGAFAKMIGINGNGSEPANGGGMPSPSSNGGGTNAVNAAPQQNNNGAPNNSVIGSPNTGANTPANALLKQGLGNSGITPNNPATALGAGQKQLETAVTGQQTNENEQLKASQERATANQRAAIQVKNLAHGFDTAYRLAHYTGARLGGLPVEGLKAMPTAAGQDLSMDQLARRYADNMKTQLANILQGGGHVNDATFDMAGNLKLSTVLEPPAERRMYHSTIATLDRLGDEARFISQMNKINPDATDTERQTMYNYWNQLAPPYDFGTFKVLPQNDKKMNLFTSREALQQFRDTGDFKLPEKKTSQASGVQQGKAESVNNPNESAKISPAARSLAKTLVLPNSVIDKKSFQDWYLTQPRMVQEAATLKWGKKKGS